MVCPSGLWSASRNLSDRSDEAKRRKRSEPRQGNLGAGLRIGAKLMIPLLILVAIPLVEIAVLIKVGQWIGFWWAFALVVATFVLGAGILGRSGFASAVRVRDALARGQPPVAAMLESALLVVAGILLMTPGFVADVIGLVLLLPPVRTQIAGLALRNLVVAGSNREQGPGPSDAGAYEPAQPGDGPVIEGEFERLDEQPIDPSSDRRRPGPGRS